METMGPTVFGNIYSSSNFAMEIVGCLCLGRNLGFLLGKETPTLQKYFEGQAKWLAVYWGLVGRTRTLNPTPFLWSSKKAIGGEI